MANLSPEEILFLNIIAQGVVDYSGNTSIAEPKIKENLEPFLEAMDLNVEYIWKGVEEMKRRNIAPLRIHVFSMLRDLLSRGENE
jgi:hypothetical protein